MSFFGQIIDYFHVYKQEISANIEDLWQSWAVRLYLSSGAAANLLAWFMAGHIYRNIGQPEMALHYSVDFGIDHYGPVRQIFILPLLGAIFCAANAILLLFLASYDKKDAAILSHLLLASALFANLLLVTALASVYLINFR